MNNMLGDDLCLFVNVLIRIDIAVVSLYSIMKTSGAAVSSLAVHC